MKPCLVCGNNIPASANKCTHCNSFQNWRRFIHFSSTILALLVALVSVATTAIPILSDAFTNDNSKLNIVFKNVKSSNSPAAGESTTEKLMFIVANSGKRPGGIAEAKLIYTISNNKIYAKNQPDFYKEEHLELLEQYRLEDNDVDTITYAFTLEMQMINAKKALNKEVFLEPGESYLLSLGINNLTDAVLYLKKGIKEVKFQNSRAEELATIYFNTLPVHSVGECYVEFKHIYFSGEKKKIPVVLECTDMNMILCELKNTKSNKTTKLLCGDKMNTKKLTGGN